MTLPKSDIYEQLGHITSEIYRYYAGNQALSRILVKEALFMTGSTGEIMHAHALQFLNHIGMLLMEAVKRKEIAPLDNPMQASAAFWSFYLLGLNLGLRMESFNVDEQVMTVKSLLRSHFPPLNT